MVWLTAATSVPAQDAVFQKGVVAADHPVASRAGAEILARGGNAIDAAVATSFCLSVVRPMSCGIGGGGFMMIHDPSAPPAERSVALNYREIAPAAVDQNFFPNRADPDASRTSGAAVAVPGTVAGLWEAHQRYGKLAWSDVLEPAIRAAEDGFLVNEDFMASAREAIAWYTEDPTRQESRPFIWRRFLREGAVSEGDRIRNPEQAKALRLIAENGPKSFYSGEIARAIVEAAGKAKGVMTVTDLESYSPQTLTPLRGSFRGRTVLVMPPPSSGGVATLQTLGVIDRYERMHGLALTDLGHNTVDSIHVLAEAMKHAFADRSEWLADPQFVDVPVAQLLTPHYLNLLASRINPEQTLQSGEYGLKSVQTAPARDAGTSHFSVIDAEGMAVACTETINLTFGSRIAVEEFGFVLNNQMDDFTTMPGAVNAFGLRQSDRNLPAPGKRPLSSMSPTIVLSVDGKVELVTGARGGPRIITSTVQSIINTLVYGMNAAEAVSAPRIHHQWFPNILALETTLTARPEAPVDAKPEEVMRLFQNVASAHDLEFGLTSRGHRLGEALSVGVLEMIHRVKDGYEAAADPRGGGAPAGVSATGEIVTSR